ncbi:phosphatase PAP2 family protein [Methanolobus bombayensis]|uniref:phosphatase PAP2 family protein n=1 Tax=Methanolobus bombayensis TaxID=38023 RepID=UPI001AE8F8D7|nr:phosphatase PAP2 family protein [Methanolobus bombayensis]MBP1910383.1 membrane-associated phospholipid phosphatase [Methanolobus bombayensis]
MLFVVVLLMNVIAYYIFIQRNYRKEQSSSGASNRDKFTFVREVLPYVGFVSLIYLLVKSQGIIVNKLVKVPGFSLEYDLARYIFLIEGNSVSIFQAFTSPVLTYISSFIYIFGFAFLLTFTFLFFLLTNQLKTLKEYAIAISVIYIVAFPFYILTPVKVTGYTLPGVTPLLYNLSPLIVNGLRTVDPLFDNCFPSLHAALSILAMLFIIFRTDLRSLKVLAVFTTLAIQFTIFYLGIHWMTDFVAGILLAFLSYFIGTKYHSLIANKLRLFTNTQNK